ncbi:hypothetical protein BCR22_08235 [Enterococcus plantarum]|uniref:hypothetical protein n=1 Tax=Enterococcus plantarum TaxID=1077675 RepID=UPI00084DC513|nr:hypothetical protein [Enterococcus plantarum]OEG08500.1 hypothetical protein BCR22_08235 [Enterococcus plantarum]
MTNFTDEQRVEISKAEYNDLKTNKKVKINGGTIGYVSKVVNDKKTREQAFIITDGNPKVQKPSEVNNVTVLYQGSTSPEKIGSQAGEVKRDWGNNKQILNNIEKSYKKTEYYIRSDQTNDKYVIVYL